MNNNELMEELKIWSTRGALGVFPSDQLPAEIKPGQGLIVNTAPTGTEGQHWLVLFRDAQDGVLEMFDTYGLPLETYPLVKQQLLQQSKNKKQEPIRRNIGQIQSEKSDSCGVYCLLYLLLRINNLANMETIITELFGDNLSLNDCIALYWLIDQFGANTVSFQNVSSTTKCFFK